MNIVAEYLPSRDRTKWSRQHLQKKTIQSRFQCDLNSWMENVQEVQSMRESVYRSNKLINNS